MATFTGKKGELRIYEYGLSGTTYYLKILFSEMNLTGPIARGHAEENMIMDRNTFDSNTHMVEGTDEPRVEGMPISWSCRIDDQSYSTSLIDWLSGVTAVANAAGGTTTINTWKAKSAGIDGITLPIFSDTKKMAYMIECLFDATAVGTDLGFRWQETYFPPQQQTVTESPDSVVMNCNGLVYGSVSRIVAFTSGASILAFT